MTPKTTTNPEPPAARGARFQWMGMVLNAVLLVFVPLCVLLLANTRSASHDTQRRAEQGLVTLSNIVSEWVSTQVNILQIEHCRCGAGSSASPSTGRAHDSSGAKSEVCLISHSAARTPPKVPAHVELSPLGLQISTQQVECPAAATPVSPALASSVSAAPASSVAAPAADSGFPCAAGARCKLIGLEPLVAQLRAQFESTRSLDGVVLEVVSEGAGGATTVSVATVGKTVPPEVKDAKQPSAPANPQRSIELDGNLLQAAACAPGAPCARTIWRLRGTLERDPWDKTFHLSVHVYILTLVAFLLLLTWPAFKVWLLAPLERISLRDAIHLLIGIPVAIAVAVIYLRSALVYHDLQLLTHERLARTASSAGNALEQALNALAERTRTSSLAAKDKFTALSPPTAGKFRAVAASFDALAPKGASPNATLDPSQAPGTIPEDFRSQLSHLAGDATGVDPDKRLPFSLTLSQFVGLNPDGTQLVKLAFADPADSSGSSARPSAMFRYGDRPYFSEANKSNPSESKVFAEFVRSRGRDEHLLILSSRVASSDSSFEPSVWNASFALDYDGRELQRGLAIIDSQGRVLAHSQSERALAENLFAATNKQQELEFWASQLGTSGQKFSFDYYGVKHFAVLRPVSAKASILPLGATGRDSWFIVAFEPDDTARNIASDVLVVSLIAVAFLMLLRLLLALANATWFQGKAEWWWPGAQLDGVRKASFALAALLQFGLCILVHPLLQRLHLLDMAVASALVATLSYTGSRLLLLPRLRDPVQARPAGDAWASLVISVACSVGLAWLCAMDFDRQSGVVLVLFAAAAWLVRDWVPLERQGSALELLFPPRFVPTWLSRVWKRCRLRWVYAAFVLSSAAVFGCFGYATAEQVIRLEVGNEFGTSQDCNGKSNWTADAIALLPFSDRTGQGVRQRAIAANPQCSTDVLKLVGRAEAALRQPDLRLPGELVPRFVPRVVGWGVVLTLSLALLMALSRRVFGLGIVTDALQVRVPPTASSEPLRLVQGASSRPPPSPSPKQLAVAGDGRSEVRIDLGQGVTALTHWERRFAPKDPSQPLRLRFLACELVLLDSELRALLLLALETVLARAAQGRDWQATLVSERELMTAWAEREHEFANSPVDQAAVITSHEVQRWSRVLSHCAFVASERTPAPKSDLLDAYLEQELGWDAVLGQQRATLRHRLGQLEAQRRAQHEVALTENEVLSCIVTVTGPRHRYLWGTCTEQEKLLLIQIAHEGFVNPHRWAMARRLCRRGLLSYGPSFRLRARSFEIFVQRALPPQALHAWERQHQAGQWQRVSTALALVILSLFGVLALGFPELTQGRLGVALTTIAGWFVVASKLNLLSGTASGVSDALGGLFPKR